MNRAANIHIISIPPHKIPHFFQKEAKWREEIHSTGSVQVHSTSSVQVREEEKNFFFIPRRGIIGGSRNTHRCERDHTYVCMEQVVEVAGIDIQVELVAVAVEELVGGEGVDAEVRLNGRPLFLGPEETA